MTRYTVQRYCARNDTNGNPRRVFVIRDEAGVIVATADEGYAGRMALGRALLALGVIVPVVVTNPGWMSAIEAVTDLGDVDVAPGIYRRMIRWTVTKP